jgi:biopolymer transport protein ExbD/biopolymer transport protein TolR
MGGGGGTNKAVSEINVTPLIDVLLVLLIIFMVIVPVTPKGLDTLIPQPPKDKSAPPPETTIVVSIQANGNGEPSYLINQDVFAKSQLEPKLQEIFSMRQGGDRVMFVKGDAALDFNKVAEVIDMGHQAGVDNIGLITPRVEAGH